VEQFARTQLVIALIWSTQIQVNWDVGQLAAAHARRHCGVFAGGVTVCAETNWNAVAAARKSRDEYILGSLRKLCG